MIDLDDDDSGSWTGPFFSHSSPLRSHYVDVGVDVCVFLRVVTRWEPIYPDWV